MNKQLTPTEIETLVVSVPVTRREKLLRFAQVVRNTHCGFVVFHNLEHYPPSDWYRIYHPSSAFSAAGRDPILREAGLKPDIAERDTSVAAAQKFFELTRDDLHEFSCDCGGIITNEMMADRIESIANKPVDITPAKALRGPASFFTRYKAW